MPPIAKPRDAASLLLLKKGSVGLSVLMGRRPPASAFIPDAFVFPGGKVDPDDRRAPCPLPLAPGTDRADDVPALRPHAAAPAADVSPAGHARHAPPGW